MKNIAINGRYKIEDNKIHLFNVASSISLNVKARSILFNVEFDKKPGYFYIIRDFDYKSKEKIFVEDKRVICLCFDDEKEHHIDLVKANESIDNTLVINEINCNGEILPQVEKKNTHVRVYGDSSIAGYGILAKEGTPDIDTNDGVENFCFRALYSLGYSYDIFAASGWGLTFSSYTNPKEVGIIDYVDNLCVCSNEKFDKKPADLLLISLGTNDNAYIEENKTKKNELIDTFIKKYRSLIEKERADNPNLPVLMIYGSLKEENVYPLIEKTYEELTKLISNLYMVKLPGDNSGLSNHSFVTYHEKMAKVLKEKIIQILSEKY